MRLPLVIAGENLDTAFFIDFILPKASRSALDIAASGYNFFNVD